MASTAAHVCSSVCIWSHHLLAGTAPANLSRLGQGWCRAYDNN